MYRKHYRLTDLSDKNSAKKVFLTITYKYGQAAMLTEELPKKSVAIPVSARVRQSVC
ncbi:MULTISPECIES: hypothetical protein [Bacteroides]|uniref:hypothetical protein n=1 Tax=Bacteroides TaxID=816 RepID=UPI0013EDCFA7|nr:MULTISPECIES: hypothetical protein [Bacteroides]MBU8996475.1 hypothetical protein [Bacteroides eggerthii]